MGFVQPTGKTKNRAFLRGHPAAALMAVGIGIAGVQTPTARDDFKAAAMRPVLDAPARSIMEAALRDEVIAPDMANALLTANPDEALTWEYMYTPAQVDGYYRALEKTIARDCKNALAQCAPRIQDYAATLYKNFRLSPDYRAWDRRHREVFMTRAAQDKMLIKARRFWHVKPGDAHFIPMKGRFAVLQRLADLYTDAFTDDAVTFQRANVVPFKLHPDLAGQYVSGSIRIRARDLRRYDFVRLAKVITHEARHNVQHNLALMARSKTGVVYLRANGIEREARILALVFGPGAPANRSVHDEGYWISPTEMEAYAKQADGEAAGRGRVKPGVLFAGLDKADQDIAEQRRSAMVKMAGAIRPAV